MIECIEVDYSQRQTGKTTRMFDAILKHCISTRCPAYVILATRHVMVDTQRRFNEYASSKDLPLDIFPKQKPPAKSEYIQWHIELDIRERGYHFYRLLEQARKTQYSKIFYDDIDTFIHPFPIVSHSYYTTSSNDDTWRNVVFVRNIIKQATILHQYSFAK